MGLEQLELEGNPSALGTDGEHRRGPGLPDVGARRTVRGGGVGHQPGAGRGGPDALELVLDEGPEALAHQHLGEDRVARLLQAEDEVPLELPGLEEGSVEVALLHPLGGDEDDAARPQRRGGLEDPAQHLGPGHGQEQVEPGRRRRLLRKENREAHLLRLDEDHRPLSHPTVDPTDGEAVPDLGTLDLEDVASAAAGEPHAAVGGEVVGEQEYQIHGRTPQARAMGGSIIQGAPDGRDGD